LHGGHDEVSDGAAAFGDVFARQAAARGLRRVVGAQGAGERQQAGGDLSVFETPRATLGPHTARFAQPDAALVIDPALQTRLSAQHIGKPTRAADGHGVMHMRQTVGGEQRVKRLRFRVWPRQRRVALHGNFNMFSRPTQQPSPLTSDTSRRVDLPQGIGPAFRIGARMSGDG